MSTEIKNPNFTFVIQGHEITINWMIRKFDNGQIFYVAKSIYNDRFTKRHGQLFTKNNPSTVVLKSLEV